MMLTKVLNPVAAESRRRNRLRRRVYQNKVLASCFYHAHWLKLIIMVAFSSQGPNFVWHLDGYDKLKPYGFAIHGCIDGYSRKMIWLKLASTNNNPKVILLYYLSTVLSCQGSYCAWLCYKKVLNSRILLLGVPTIMRSDCGTENSMLAACHMVLRHEHGDEFSCSKSFRYGSSTTNTVNIAIATCIIVTRVGNNSMFFHCFYRELKAGGDSWENQLLTIGWTNSR